MTRKRNEALVVILSYQVSTAICRQWKKRAVPQAFSQISTGQHVEGRQHVGRLLERIACPACAAGPTVSVRNHEPMTS